MDEEQKTNMQENECETTLADTIIDLKRQLEETEQRRKEADARAVELAKILRNTGTQTAEKPQKEATLNELLEDLF